MFLLNNGCGFAFRQQIFSYVRLSFNQYNYNVSPDIAFACYNKIYPALRRLQ